MKYSLKQHLLGITDEEYTVVNNFEPPLEDELTEQKAEFVDTKEKSSGLFSAVIAQLVENRGAPRKMNYNFDEIDSDVDKNSFRDANKQRRMMDREESRSGSALNSADGRNPRDHMSNSELAADREWEAEQRGERQAMHGTEEEMETKMTANHDRDMEFQGNISRLSKSTDADNRASTPDNKRLKQRYNRYKRKTWGEEEMEQKMPANRDRVQGIVNRGFGDEAEGDPSIQRRGQRARRRLKADGYKGDRLNAAGRPSEEQEEENREAEDYILNRDRSHPNYRSSVERDDKAWEVGRETSGNNMPSKKRLKQKIGRFQRSVNGKASEEQEEQRMAPRGMNYKFDERPPAKGANRHKSLPTGKSGRGNRVVNNSLYRPKTKDDFVKDKAASAFKEGDVGGIFAAAFGMIKEGEEDYMPSQASMGLIRNTDNKEQRFYKLLELVVSNSSKIFGLVDGSDDFDQAEAHGYLDQLKTAWERVGRGPVNLERAEKVNSFIATLEDAIEEKNIGAMQDYTSEINIALFDRFKEELAAYKDGGWKEYINYPEQTASESDYEHTQTMSAEDKDKAYNY